jgi:hypothetical protein
MANLSKVFNWKYATRQSIGRAEAAKEATLAQEFCVGCRQNNGDTDEKGFPICKIAEVSTQFIFQAGDITTMDAKPPKGCERG